MDFVKDLLLRVPRGHRLHNVVTKVVRGFSEEIASLNSQLQEKQIKSNTLEEKCGLMSERVAELETELREQNNEVINEKMLNDQLQSANSSFENVKRRIKEENLVLVKQLSSLRNEIDQQKRAFAMISTEKISAEEMNCILKNKHAGDEEQMAIMKKELEKVNREKLVLEKKMKKMSEESIERSLEHKTSLRNLEIENVSRVESYEEERKALLIENEHLKKVELGELKNEISVLGTKEEYYQCQVASLREEIDSLQQNQKKVRRLQMHLRLVEVEKKEYEKEVCNLVAQMKLKDEHSSNIRDELARLEKRISKMEKGGYVEKRRVSMVNTTLSKMREVLSEFFEGGDDKNDGDSIEHVETREEEE